MGCPSSAPNDTGNIGTDAWASGDTGPLADTGPVADTGAPADTSPVADTGPVADAGMSSHTVASALRALSRAECVCSPHPEYATADICASVDFGAPAGDVCYERAEAEGGPEVQRWWSCLRDGYVALEACRSECSAEHCYDDFTDAFTACGTEPFLEGYESALARCINETVVGDDADSCSDTAVASMMTGTGVFTGTTVGAGDHRTSKCSTWGISGADVMHRWAAPATGDYRFDTAGSEFDTVLFALDGCAADASERVCNDNNIGVSALSEFELTLEAGETIQLGIEGYKPTSAGAYRINITAL